MSKPDPKLQDLCREHGKDLNPIVKVDGIRLLAALLYCESKFGKNCKPKVHMAYTPSGKCFNDKLKKAYDQYQEKASCSWGPWQIMYATALELGYQGPPDDLAQPEVSLPYVVKYLNEGIANGAICVSQLADYYNSGAVKNRKVITGYLRKCIGAYNGLAKGWLNGVITAEDKSDA